jgi:hypothetical protein
MLKVNNYPGNLGLGMFNKHIACKRDNRCARADARKAVTQ